MELNIISMAWDISNFLKNAKNTLSTWGGYLFMLFGVVLIIVGIFQIVKKFVAPNSAPGGWAMPIVMLIIGGALAVGGWSFVFNIAQGGKQTIEDLGAGKQDTGATGATVKTIVNMLPYYKDCLTNIGVLDFIKTMF